MDFLTFIVYVIVGIIAIFYTAMILGAGITTGILRTLRRMKDDKEEKN